MSSEEESDTPRHSDSDNSERNESDNDGSSGDEHSDPQVSQAETNRTMSKQVVMGLISHKDVDIEFRKVQGTSPCWLKFEKVFYKKAETHFVQCKHCKALYTFRSKDGTTGLKNHKCPLAPIKSNASITRFIEVKPSQDDKKKVISKIAAVCGEDLRPFNFAQGLGFTDMCQNFITLGAKYGAALQATDLLPVKQTVGDTVEKLGDEARASLVEEIALVKSQNAHFAVTLDLWTHSETTIKYLTITLHYIILSNNQWELVERVLATRALDVDERQTGDVIRAKAFGILREFGIDPDYCTYITDNGTNMVAALSQLQWISCGDHNINLANVYGTAQLGDESEVRLLTSASKALVGYVKRTGLQRKLSPGLKLRQQVDTRWNSTFSMLSSIQRALPELREIMISQEAKRHLNNCDLPILETLLELLRPMYQATELLSSSQTPTIHLVVPILASLKQKLDASYSDPEIHPDVKKFAKSLKEGLTMKFRISDIHKMSTLLHPKYRDVVQNVYGKEEEQRIIHLLKDKVELKAVLGPVDHPASNSNTVDVQVRPAASRSGAAENQKERLSLEDVVLGDLQNRHNAESNNINELDSYLSSAVSMDSDNILEFWFKRDAFPVLRQVARDLLAIPASSSSSERSFSVAGRLLEKRRCRLKPKRVDSVLVLHSYLIVKKKRLVKMKQTPTK